MKLVILILTTLFVFSSAIDDEELHAQWSKFQADFGKSYRSPFEARRRLDIFQKKLENIETHNKQYEKGEVTYMKGVNQFSDWSHDEYLKYVNKGLKKKRNLSDSSVFRKSSNFVAPDRVDWREQGVITGVKDQLEHCGACWAFASVGAIEAHLAIKNKTLISLSEQQLVDCSWSQGNKGCGGGQMVPSFQYVQQNGIVKEEDYPYKAKENDECLADNLQPVTKVSGYVEITPHDEDALIEAIATRGPVAIAVDSSTFEDYKSGVFSGPCSSLFMNHAMLIVGYGSENGLDYYIVKNSYSNKWGDNGYIKFERNKNTCGLSNQPSFPLL